MFPLVRLRGVKHFPEISTDRPALLTLIHMGALIHLGNYSAESRKNRIKRVCNLQRYTRDFVPHRSKDFQARGAIFEFFGIKIPYVIL